MGDYRPDDSEEEVDIRVRYPEEYRGIDQLDTVRISTPNGPVPISSFVTREARQKSVQFSGRQQSYRSCSRKPSPRSCSR